MTISGEKRRGAPYCAVKNEHIQYVMMVLDTGHLIFTSNEKIRIYHSLKTSHSRVNRKCVHALYKNCVK